MGRGFRPSPRAGREMFAANANMPAAGALLCRGPTKESPGNGTLAMHTSPSRDPAADTILPLEPLWAIRLEWMVPGCRFSQRFLLIEETTPHLNGLAKADVRARKRPRGGVLECGVASRRILAIDR